MKRLFQWNKPADRTTFCFTAIVTLLCIYLFPFFLNNFLFSVIDGAEGSAARMILRALITPLVIILGCIPLLTVTRRRLLDLGLSGIFLFTFPIWPLASLAAGPLLAVVMFPLGGNPPLIFNPAFWLGTVCLIILAFVPGRTAGSLPKHPIFLSLLRLTECRSRINMTQFRKKAFLLIGSAIGLSVLPATAAKAGGLIIFTFITISIKIATLVIVLVLTANAIRRLNDLGRGYLWSIIIPLSLPHLLEIIARFFPLPLSEGSALRQLFFEHVGVMGNVAIIGMISCTAVLVWLMTGTTSEHPLVTHEPDVPVATLHSKGTFFSPGKFALIGLAAVLVFFSIYKTSHPFDYYRYKMTVFIETPEGLKTGSAVRQGNYEEGSERRASWAVGEAVVVDLGKRGLAFALIDSSNIGDGISYVATCNLPEFGLKETPIGKKWILSPSEYPKLVAFKDPNNPKTMQSLLEIEGNGNCGSSGLWKVQADHFEDMFGLGVKLKEISLEITDDPVTIGIEKQLPWLYCNTNINRTGEDFSEARPLDIGTFKREPREFYLKKMKELPTGPERPECVAFQKQWAAYEQKKFQDEFQHWQQLANQGDAEAQFMAGNLIAKGDGHEIPENREEAVKWYTLAAKQGYQDAQTKLAHSYQFGEGVKKDWQEAYFWACLATLGTGGHSLTNNSVLLSFAPKQITPEQKTAVELRVREWKPAVTSSTLHPITDIATLSKKLLDAAYTGPTEIAKLLVERGADINTRNEGGNTPLMLASMQGDVDLVRFLIDKRADINAVNSGGWTALFMAAQQGNTEVAKILLENGIDVTVRDEVRRATAQQTAEESHHMDIASLIAEFVKKQKP